MRTQLLLILATVLLCAVGTRSLIPREAPLIPRYTIGGIWPGMTSERVRERLGRPQGIGMIRSADGEETTWWDYPDGLEVDLQLRGGRMIATEVRGATLLRDGERLVAAGDDVEAALEKLKGFPLTRRLAVLTVTVPGGDVEIRTRDRMVASLAIRVHQK